ncbi:TIGR01457 family HAD-type hydrolase [Paenibacillus sp. GSMTC-2017]|uniref:TIGR01457 family HAD-type hydrolase n=1 Tax=Paenibacillus sp. GSMTC-2017 TaxID=2794350 RepID=UPI0018D6C1AC|nr:TIGR01457 family HAD-type hydrolase [Paenibacillus sp. GSMTC-2017]MBH5317765.1 TIGR01457 family HAD-type hydrolase [Paenibacillus sp. GSMTC-2017]
MNERAMKGLLIDLDGTLYHGTTMIDGADRLIHYLRNESIPYRFVTNNSASSPEEVANRLEAMGIPATSEDVCTSAQATAQYVAGLQPKASVYVIGESGLHEAIQDAGLRITDQFPDFVVQGIDRNLSYERIAQAVRYIREGATYILTNPDLLLPSTNGLIPGAGSIGAMLKAASGKEPVLIGKPSSILMDYSLTQLGVPNQDTWVVGDNIATDIAAGIAADCGTLLVLTGLTTAANYSSYSEAARCKPDLICESLEALIQTVSNHR